MSNKTRLQTNNTNLQALIDKANALPEAGSGGGGVETCTVTLTVTTGIARYGATKYVDGILTCENSISMGAVNLTLNNVVKGSCLTVTYYGRAVSDCSASNCTVEQYVVAEIDQMFTVFFKVND